MQLLLGELLQNSHTLTECTVVAELHLQCLQSEQGHVHTVNTEQLQIYYDVAQQSSCRAWMMWAMLAVRLFHFEVM